MASNKEFERLRLLFTRSTALPNIRCNALELVEAIDNGIVSATQLEMFVASDPALTTVLLRKVAATGNGEGKEGVTTIRAAIEFLGVRTLRTLANSLSLQGLMLDGEATEGFNPLRFARHSLFVGLVASYLYEHARQKSPEGLTWNAEEVLSAGVIHDIPFAILWKTTPEVFQEVYDSAANQSISFEKAFQQIHGYALGDLGAVAAEAWNLPAKLRRSLQSTPWPADAKEHELALCALDFANFLAVKSGFSITSHTYASDCDPRVLQAMKVDDEETITSAIRHATEQVNQAQPLDHRRVA